MTRKDAIELNFLRNSLNQVYLSQEIYINHEFKDQIFIQETTFMPVLTLYQSIKIFLILYLTLCYLLIYIFIIYTIMLEKIVEKILNPILNEYLEDFNAENMKIGLWSGEVVIKNVRLKKQVLKKMNLPFKLKYSRLGCLKMTIPWKSLSSSKIDVIVQGLQLIISEIPQSQWQCKNHKIIQKRKKEIASFCQSIVQDFMKKSASSGKQEEDKGYFGNLVVRILDNIQLTIKDIHVRYEDEITKLYSFGVTLEQLKIFTVNRNGYPEYVDRSKKQYENQPLRKRLILSNFGFYWNQQSQFFSQSDPHTQMIESIAKGGKQNKMNYLILMSSNAELYQRQAGKQYVEPEINLFIQFEEMNIKITNQQLQQIITLAERLQSYMNQVKLQNRKKLSYQEMLTYHKQFLQLFPAYFEKKSTETELNRIQSIIEKMEIANFTEGMKKYLKQKQKQKMMKEKLDKKKGWFSFSKPKQLSEEEVNEIQNFMKDNFGLETKVVKRPEDFYYIKVNFSLKTLKIGVANTKNKSSIEQGLLVKLINIDITTSLREGGYLLNFQMADLNVDLYKKSESQNEMLSIVRRMPEVEGQIKAEKYAKLCVVGSPLDKKHLNTQLFLQTQELLIEFDSKIIKVAKDFSNLKINSKNKEAAIEAYGDIKNKVAEAATEAANNIGKTEKKKNFLSIDVRFKSINILLLFQPEKINGDLWAINLGETKIFSDADTLLKPQFTEDQAMEKYGLKTTRMSVIHFQSKSDFINSFSKRIDTDPKQRLFNDLSIDLQIQIFKKSSTTRPSIRSKAIIHTLDLNLTSFTYTWVQKIGNCFAIPTPPQVEQEKKVQVEKIKANQKTQIMKEQKKIGILYDQSGKQVKKYIGVLSGGYIYLFVDKKDVQYSNYYYVRNSKLYVENEVETNKKAFSLVIENNVNKAKLGFDKEAAAQQWKKSISALEPIKDLIISEEDGQKKQKSNKIAQVDPNNLNFEIYAAIQKIRVTTLLASDKRAMISINQLKANAKIYETKVLADVSLQSIQISDNVYNYKYSQLSNFLYSQSIQGSTNLIDIKFEQLSAKNPAYQQVDSTIGVEMGKLVCNYKPQSVQNVMRFFLPPKKPQSTQIIQKVSNTSHNTLESSIIEENAEEAAKKRKKLKEQSLKSQPQKYSMKLTLKISQISIALVNRKTKVLFSRIGLNNFKLYFGLSNKQMKMLGGLSELWLTDLSNYPNTIIEQQEEYKQQQHIIRSFNKTRDMVTFDINILEIPNQKGKSMIIKSGLYDLQASYIQQPVLRMITYLVQQMLPALTPSSDPNKPHEKIMIDTKPEYSTMQIIIDLQNILAAVKLRNGLGQSLELLIKNIEVRNSCYQRQYIDNPKDESQKVFVQNYDVKLKGISITERFNGKQIKLTNDLNIDVGCQMVMNTLYYVKTYGKRYKSGMRITCKLSPFFMKMSHQDYNFMMKCLFWNISFDDNADGYLFDPVIKKNLPTNYQEAQPLYTIVLIEKIILCVTENEIPLAVMFMDQLNLDLLMENGGMKIDLVMKTLFATNIVKSEEEGISIQKGMFNLFGWERKLVTKQLLDIEKLVQIYSLDSLKQSLQKVDISGLGTKPMMKVIFETTKNSDMFLDVNIEGLKIAISLRELLVLSKLALLQPNIQPPKSTLIPIANKKKAEAPAPNSGSSTMNIRINEFLGSLSDKSGKNYIVIQGDFVIVMKMVPSKKEEQVLEISKKIQITQGPFMELNSYRVELRNFCIYFCDITKLKNKRYILQPMLLYLRFSQQYSIKSSIVVLDTSIDGQVEKIIFQCSVRDMIMINKITQDNLQALAQNPKNEDDIKNQQKEISQIKAKESVIDQKQTIKDLTTIIEKKIQTKTIASVSLQPIQLRVVNDCQNNFMPVVSFIIQETKIIFESDAIKAHLTNVLTIKLDFFNPRSANWEPIIESFRISLDYLNVVNEFGKKNIIIVTGSDIQEFKELKINASTQLVSTLLTTLQIAKEQKDGIQKISTVDQIQVSPYIIENKTNKVIKINRIINLEEKQIQLPPLFRGPIKLSDKGGQIHFIFEGRRYTVSLEKFGLICVPDLDSIHLKFRMEKVNRIIEFVNYITLENASQSDIYCVRFNQKKERLQENIIIHPGDSVPFESDWYLQLSLNGKSSTPLHPIKQLPSIEYLVSEKKKFKLSVREKRVVLCHSIFMIRAPFKIVNDLPKSLNIQFILDSKMVSSKQIVPQGSHEVFANQEITNLRFKILCEGFYWSDEFYADSQCFGKKFDLYLKDRENGGTSIVCLFERDQILNQYRLRMFCTAFIISELDYDIDIYTNLKKDEKTGSIEKYYKLGGQTKFWNKEIQSNTNRKIDKKTLIGSESGNLLRVCGSNCLIDFSNPIPLNKIGVSQTRIVVETEMKGRVVPVFTTLGVDVSLKQINGIVLKKITLRHRQIFYNNTEVQFFIKQKEAQKFYYSVNKHQKRPFYYVLPEVKNNQRSVVFKLIDSKDSIPISVNSLGSTFFKLESLQNQFYRFFKLNIQQIDSYLYYELTQINYNDLPYQVVVRSEKLQIYIPLFNCELNKNSPPLHFINEIPQQPYNLQFFVRVIGSQAHQEVVARADDFNYVEKLTFYEKEIQQTFIFAKIYVLFNDNKKFIVVDEVHTNQQEKPEYQVQSINFKLEKISLSIIENSSQSTKPYQSFYFYLSNLEFLMEKSNRRTIIQTKLQFLQFDQSEPYIIINPVVITPSRYNQYMNPGPKEKALSIFNSVIQIDNSFVKNLVLNSLVIQLNDICINIATSFIKCILDITKQFTNVSKSDNFLGITNQVELWRKITPPVEGNKTFIKKIKIAPVTLSISAHLRLNQLDLGNTILFQTVLSALGVVITDIDDSPIFLQGLDLTDCTDTLQGINKKMGQHYKNSIMGQLYKIFGSLNIIGNPVSLFNNVSRGFKDLKQKPAQGFVQGPLQFGKGLAQGTTSLIANSVGGALNSVQKITGTVASGLAALTFDKQFQERRQRQKMKKPKNVVDGISKGGKAIFRGFKQGISGLVLKPIERTQQQGAKGFFKGVAQGVTGVIVKPVTGVIDFASKTTEGLKNTALSGQDKPNENRIRYPRALYTQVGIVKEYDPVDSKLQGILKRSKYEEKYRFSREHFIASFRNGEQVFIIVLSQSISNVNINKQEVYWSIPMTAVKTSINSQNPLSSRISGPPKSQQFWDKSIDEQIMFQNSEQAEKFNKMIIDLRLNSGKF